MRAVLQRVSRACVRVHGREVGSVAAGYVALLGVEHGDGERDAEWMAHKIARLRLFSDAQGKMNEALGTFEASGRAALVISQFTLLADANHGLRPSFSGAATPEVAEPLYELVVAKLRAAGVRVETGVFGANMQVELVNDGPVTLLLDSPKRD